MIVGMAHACFVVSDLERSLSFYRDQLGLPEAFSFINDAGHRHGVYLHLGGRNFIELFEGTVEPPATDQSYKHICLEVKDIEGTVADLRSKGVEVSDPKLGTDQSWQAWIVDPDGNRMELHEYTASSWQAPSLS